MLGLFTIWVIYRDVNEAFSLLPIVEDISLRRQATMARATRTG
jgi:hypothetical protein